MTVDCDGGGRSLLGSGATFVIDLVANEASSWTSVKGLYR